MAFGYIHHNFQQMQSLLIKNKGLPSYTTFIDVDKAIRCTICPEKAFNYLWVLVLYSNERTTLKHYIVNMPTMF